MCVPHAGSPNGRDGCEIIDLGFIVESDLTGDSSIIPGTGGQFSCWLKCFYGVHREAAAGEIALLFTTSLHHYQTFNFSAGHLPKQWWVESVQTEQTFSGNTRLRHIY